MIGLRLRGGRADANGIGGARLKELVVLGFAVVSNTWLWRVLRCVYVLLDVVEALEQVELEQSWAGRADRRDTGVIARRATMSPTKVTALMRNGDATPSVAIATPPTTGPISVETRPAAALSVTASDRCTRGTSRGKSAWRAAHRTN